MRILAIDPGNKETQFLIWDGAIVNHGFEPNIIFLHRLRESMQSAPVDLIAVEVVACYGMPVGRDVFETCEMVGRIKEICRDSRTIDVLRKDVKMHLCHSMKAKDGNIRQALIDRLGPQGTKKAPGPTYGISKHAWSALAIAVYANDTFNSPLAPGCDRGA